MILPLIFVVAALYSSVGHGGASGYLAVFTLAGVAVADVVPLVLVLNIIVASVSFWQYFRNGHFRWKILLPFALVSVPAAFLGGLLHVPKEIFGVVLAVALILSAMRLIYVQGQNDAVSEPATKSLWKWGIPAGTTLGFVSGMIGIGGGVFLSPLLIFLRWCDMRRTAAISAAFIVLNSIGGLAGKLQTHSFHPQEALPFIAAALAGGYIGSHTAVIRFQPRTLKGILAFVLLLAGGKLLLPLLH